MTIILMRQHRDCLVACLATALQTTWKKAAGLLLHCDLKSPLTSLLFSTHWWLLFTLWRHDIKHTVSRRFEPDKWVAGKTIVLVHAQGNWLQRLWGKHWIVYQGQDYGTTGFCWGDSKKPVRYLNSKAQELFEAWPQIAVTIIES